MKLPQRTFGEVAAQVDVFWQEVRDHLSRHPEPAGGWDAEVRRFRQVLDGLAAPGPADDGPGQKLGEGIYHFSPSQVAQAIATGRFHQAPERPPGELLESLLSADQPTHA